MSTTRTPVYRIKEHLVENPRKTIQLGGWSALDAPVITLSQAEPFIYDDQPHLERYKVYLGTHLRLVDAPKKVDATLKSKFAALHDNIESGKPLNMKPASEPHTPKQEDVYPNFPKSEPQSLEVNVEADDVQSIELSALIPSAEELESQNREALISLAEKLGVWEDIKPASGTYKTKADILNHLLALKGNKVT